VERNTVENNSNVVLKLCQNNSKRGERSMKCHETK